MPKDHLTLKGLFERLIRLESKIDLIKEKNKKTDVKFTSFAILVVLVELINLWLNYLIKSDHGELIRLLEALK